MKGLENIYFSCLAEIHYFHFPLDSLASLMNFFLPFDDFSSFDFLLKKLILLTPKLTPITHMGIMQFYPTEIFEHRENECDLKMKTQYSPLKRDEKDFLNHITINDVTCLDIWQAQYSAMCSEDGGILDDILVYRYPDYFMLVVNCSNIEKNLIGLSRISQKM